MKSLKSLFLKIINISTLLTLNPRSSLPKKKIFIFLHVAKSGGSSFWNSLVDSINSSNNKYNFAIDDTYERAIKEFQKIN